MLGHDFSGTLFRRAQVLAVSRIPVLALIFCIAAANTGGAERPNVLFIAVDGTLSVMVGGKQEIFDRCLPVLKATAASVVLVGDVGAGNAAKLANHVVVALVIAALSEALVLAVKAGVEPELLFKAICGGLAGSTVRWATHDARASSGSESSAGARSGFESEDEALRSNTAA